MPERPDLIVGHKLTIEGIAVRRAAEALRTPYALALQGGTDQKPAPGYTESILNHFVANGGATDYVLYPTLGHGTWNRGYSEDDYFTRLLSHKMNDIHVLYDNREICPGDPINVTMGFTPCCTNYEWRKDGVLIAGENNNTLNVYQF